MTAPIEIPNRAVFRSAEVCELVQVQPYVLRTWEAEFPTLGVSRTPGGARVYRREDVERVLQIKHLLVDEGLTLAGIRRRLEGPSEAAANDEVPISELLGQDARERLQHVKRGLRSLLELLTPAGAVTVDVVSVSTPAVEQTSLLAVAEAVEPPASTESPAPRPGRARPRAKGTPRGKHVTA